MATAETVETKASARVAKANMVKLATTCGGGKGKGQWFGRGEFKGKTGEDSWAKKLRGEVSSFATPGL
jgi:hypothetical protein